MCDSGIRFNIERLTELLCEDRFTNPSKYSVVLVSEGATFSGGNMIFQSEETDMFGHKKLGGIGNMISQQLKELTPQFNHGQVTTPSRKDWAIWFAVEIRMHWIPSYLWHTGTLP